MISLRGVRPQVDRKLGLDPQDVSPFHCPIIGKLIPLQKPINQEPPFVLRVGVLQEIPGLSGGRQRAEYIQISAADKDRIRAEDGLDL